MSIRSISCATSGILLLVSSQLNASVIFFTDSAAFNAAANTSIIDFEGIVADDAISPPANAVEINNVVFTTDPQQASARIFGKDFNAPDVVTDSALFVADNGNNIIVDLVGVGSSITAAGGIFGDYNGPAGQQVQFNIFNSFGIIDTQTVVFGDMRVGEPKTFFGWVAVGGDEITQIQLIGNLNSTTGIRFSALDDFQYGTVIPVPAAAWLFGSGLIGLIGFAMRTR